MLHRVPDNPVPFTKGEGTTRVNGYDASRHSDCVGERHPDERISCTSYGDAYVSRPPPSIWSPCPTRRPTSAEQFASFPWSQEPKQLVTPL
jgi:hypothetical protein